MLPDGALEPPAYLEESMEMRGRLGMNAIIAIHPYKYEGLWVFDDAKVGLVVFGVTLSWPSGDLRMAP